MVASAGTEVAKTETPAGGQDPSMEEILHSIRQIISEDDDGKKPADNNAVPGSDVLELTEMMEEKEIKAPEPKLEPKPEKKAEAKPEPKAAEPKKTEAAPAAAAPADVLGSIDAALTPQDTQKTPEKMPEPTPEKPKENAAVATHPQPSANQSEADALLSNEAASAASSAMKHLKDVADPEPPSPTASTPSPTFASGNTVEAMVMQMIKPMMKEWLDANLPGIVERIVEKEVRKLTK